jgi:hypothetical protein
MCLGREVRGGRERKGEENALAEEDEVESVEESENLGVDSDAFLCLVVTLRSHTTSKD